jgi:hypothetical protein
LAWSDLTGKGITADDLNAAANAAAKTTYSSEEGRSWDYIQDTDGVVSLKKGDKVRAIDGKIYSFTQTGPTLLDLGAINFDSSSWAEVSPKTYEVKAGFTVRIDPLTVGVKTKDATADGLADRVYRFIGGPDTDWYSSDGEQILLEDETVRVEPTAGESLNM